MRLNLLSIGNDFLAVSVDSVITSIDLLLKTVIEPGLPKIYNLIGSSRNEVISLPAEFDGVGMGLKCVL